ncbi:MAG: AbrB/MazE/SpoVT family DNA-binding domain-containing protein [Candidatus Bathyarchaeia archaeon]
MVELRIKVGPKGQILIPKVFRDRYGLKEGDAIVIEPEEDGVLIRGRPSTQETEREIERHLSELKAKGIRGPRLGELKTVYLEMEFEEKHAEAIPRR